MLAVDPTSALARQHVRDLHADAHGRALVRLALTCCPSAVQRAAVAARRAVPRAGAAVLAWLRAGQLGPGYQRECCL